MASNNVFQKFLLKACQGTSVTPRDLVSALTLEDIAAIKSGEMVVGDVLEIVVDLADSKDNELLYKVPMGKKDSNYYFSE